MASGIRLTDLELLSAYLDDELSSRERAALEVRLAAEPELQSELDELRRTVQILRAAPPLTPPRSFTLDPAVYRRRPPWWLRYGAFRLAGVLGTAAALLFIAFGVLLMSNAPAPKGLQSIVRQATQPASDALTLKVTSIGLLAPTSVSAGAAGLATTNPPPSPAPAVALQATATSTAAPARASSTALSTAAAETDRSAEPLNSASPAARDKSSVTVMAAAPTLLPPTPTQEAFALGGAATPAVESEVPTREEAATNGRRADETTPANVPAPSGGPEGGTGYMAAPTATVRAMEPLIQATLGKSAGAIPPMVGGALTATPAPTLAALSAAAATPTATLTVTPTGTPVPSATARPFTVPSSTPLPSAARGKDITASATPSGTVTPGITLTPPVNEITAPPQSLDPTARLLLVVGITLLIISLVVFGIAWARSRL